jgi:DNA polymerase III gamma/tau subunit
MKAMKVSKDPTRSITPQDVRDIVGALDDAKVAALLATGAKPEELEEAMAWASGESDVMGELERPLEGVVARLYEILMSGEEFPEDRD